MGKLLLAFGSFLLMIHIPTFIKTPDGDPYLVVRPDLRFDQATYIQPYHEILKRISVLTGPKEETVRVFARQDSKGNMYFSDKADPEYRDTQTYDVHNTFNGRLAFPPHWIWGSMLAIWILLFSIGWVLMWCAAHLYAKLFHAGTQSPTTRPDDRKSKKTTQKKNNTSEKTRESTSPFHILGVTEDASLEEIKAAYRKKIKAYHPDRVAHLGTELQEIAQKKSTEINRAYEMLQSK